MAANGEADRLRRLEKEAELLKRKLAASERDRTRLENYLDKHSALFKANIRELESEIAVRKRAEQEMRAAKNQAEEATALKDMFVSLVAHDLRAPLANIKGLLDLLQARANAPFTAAQRAEMTHGASTTAGSMLTLIEKLLDLSRLQTGSVKLRKRVFTPARLAKELAETFRYQAEMKEITLTLELDGNQRVLADPDLYREVLRNLVSNAMKFTPKGGAVTIYSPAGSPGVLAVKDTGAGIAPHLLPHLFKSEIKTTTPGTDGEKGTGLGLPYAHGIMKLHGGALLVETTQGAGTVFFAALAPVTPAVALVERDKTCRSAVKTMLTPLGPMEYIESANLDAALAVIKGVSLNLVIVDYALMEERGGAFVTSLRTITAEDEYPPPVLVVGGGEDWKESELEAARIHAMAMGAMDFAPKPLAPDDLRERVNWLIG